MDTKKKAIVGLLMIALAAGGLILPAVFAEDQQAPTEDGAIGRRPLQRRAAIWLRFVKNGVPETLEGEAKAHKGFILVLEEEGENTYVLIPRFWLVNDEIINSQELLDGEPFGMGDDMTMETMMLELVKETHTVRSYLAYSITVDGVKAEAVLPFNIDP